VKREPFFDRGGSSEPPRPDEVWVSWDAGAIGCGELVLELRFRLQSLQPGALFLLTATDPGARKDLPTWCRLTGHALVKHAHPHYWIRRRKQE
jgi:tRNA 2-thiouridine synthesizing protein A